MNDLYEREPSSMSIGAVAVSLILHGTVLAAALYGGGEAEAPTPPLKPVVVHIVDAPRSTTPVLPTTTAAREPLPLHSEKEETTVKEVPEKTTPAPSPTPSPTPLPELAPIHSPVLASDTPTKQTEAAKEEAAEEKSTEEEPAEREVERVEETTVAKAGDEWPYPPVDGAAAPDEVTPDKVTDDEAASLPPATDTIEPYVAEREGELPDDENAEEGAVTEEAVTEESGEQSTAVNLFPSEKTLGELAKRYEGTPIKEKTKTLTLNSSDIRYAKYLRDMKRRIELYWEYPLASVKRGEQGKLRISFTIMEDGTVVDIKVSGSPYPGLNDAALTAIRLANPFGPLPDGTGAEELRINATFFYSIITTRGRS